MFITRLAVVLAIFCGLSTTAHGACTSPLAATQHFLDNLQEGDG